MLDAPAPLVPLLTGEFPRQRAFSYPRTRWQHWTGHLDGVGEVLRSLPDELDRHTTAQHVRDLVARNVACAFTVAMIWGHGYSGYGPYRTARILTGSSTSARVSPVCPDVVHRLTRSIEIARTEGALAGYLYLNNRDGKVRGLGAAFFTKWLYFVTADGDPHSPAAAPVLDVLIIRWLGSTASVQLRSNCTADYARYIDLLQHWGQPHDLSAAEVEERIFRLIRNDGAA